MADSKQKLEDDIVAWLGAQDGPRNYTEILTHFRGPLLAIATPYRYVGRLLDRRLQSLRKAGRIRYTGKAWEVCNG